MLGSMNTPTHAEKRKLVTLLAAYINKDGARISVQQKAYTAWMLYLEKLEKNYPNIDFRSEAIMNSLVNASKHEASKKLFRGAGSTF